MSAATPKVNILLSTYNGARFLQEQLDSLQSQDYPSISIYVRDDGSTDNSLEIIERYQEQYSKVSLVSGENIGATNSFFELIRSYGDVGQFYAFCDQDDIWDSHKVSSSVEMIQNSVEPAMTLYFCRRKLVDEDLQPLGFSPSPRSTSFASAIYDLPAYGCSTVFGDGIRELFLQGNPKSMLGHDWWAYLIATVFGYVIYDTETFIQYRLHNANVSVPRMGLQKLKFHVKDLIERLIRKEPAPVDFLAQAERFISTYNDVPLNMQEVVEELFLMRKPDKLLLRSSYAFSPSSLYSDPVSSTFLRLMFMLGCH